MALLRDLLAVRRAAGRPLKVVLMSATLDSSLFADYFGACPVLHAQARRGRWELASRERAAGRACSSARCGLAAPAGRARGAVQIGPPAPMRLQSTIQKCCIFDAPLLQGRTFPVEQLFLEDCYEATGGSRRECPHLRLLGGTFGRLGEAASCMPLRQPPPASPPRALPPCQPPAGRRLCARCRLAGGAAPAVGPARPAAPRGHRRRQEPARRAGGVGRRGGGRGTAEPSLQGGTAVWVQVRPHAA